MTQHFANHFKSILKKMLCLFWIKFQDCLYLLSHPGIPGVTLCFCTGSYAATATAAAAAGRRFLSSRSLLNNFLDFFHFWHDCWPWPIDLLIRSWAIFVVTLTLNIQCQISNWLYLSQKWSDCHQTKSKHINWTLGFKWDHQVWPWPWPWPRIFKVKYRIEYISAKKWCDCHKTKSKHIDWSQDLKCDHQVWPWSWPWPWIFKVEYGIGYISAKNGPIATKRKANTSIEL